MKDSIIPLLPRHFHSSSQLQMLSSSSLLNFELPFQSPLGSTFCSFPTESGAVAVAVPTQVILGKHFP